MPSKQKKSQDVRRFLSRAETCTLLGMILCVFGLFFTWQSRTIDMTKLPPGSVFLATGGNITVSGFALSIRWPMIVCAIFCGTALLWTPPRSLRLPVTVLQVACGLACFLIALLRVALLPGVLMGLIGGALLTFGAIDRYADPPVKV